MSMEKQMEVLLERLLLARISLCANKSLSSNTSICFSMGSDVSPFVDHPRQRPIYGKFGRVERYEMK